jgi:hypothetical protein
VGLGVLYHRSGNPALRAGGVRALRTARRRRMLALAGAAHHELFVFELTRTTWTRRTRTRRPPGGVLARAPAPPRPRALTWSLLVAGLLRPALACSSRSSPASPSGARASSWPRGPVAVGWAPASATNARAATLALLDRDPACHAAAESLLLLARADNSMAEWARAEAAATRAVQIAGERHESHTRMLAEAQLDAARRRLATHTASAAEPVMLAYEAERLVGQFERSLRLRSELSGAAA